jgi:hypothetical protein
MTGCVTEQKVKNWNDKHPVQASQYCSINFPVEEQTTVEYRVDSADYKNVVDSIQRFADSILDASGRDTQYIERIREKIRTEIKWRLAPCIDSSKIVTIKKESTARIKYLQLLLDQKDKTIDQKDKTITQRDERITTLEEKLSRNRKLLWLFGILLALGILYMTRKLWMPVLLRI